MTGPRATQRDTLSASPWEEPTYRTRKGTWVKHKHTGLYGQIEKITDGCAIIAWAYPGEAHDRLGETYTVIPLGDLRLAHRV